MGLEGEEHSQPDGATGLIAVRLSVAAIHCQRAANAGWILLRRAINTGGRRIHQSDVVVWMECSLIERNTVEQRVAARGNVVKVEGAVDVSVELGDRPLVKQIGERGLEPQRLRLGQLVVLREVEVGLDVPGSALGVRRAGRNDSATGVLVDIDPFPAVDDVYWESAAGVRYVEPTGNA